jgi:hypothetical protein
MAPNPSLTQVTSIRYRLYITNLELSGSDTFANVGYAYARHANGTIVNASSITYTNSTKTFNGFFDFTNAPVGAYTVYFSIYQYYYYNYYTYTAPVSIIKAPKLYQILSIRNARNGAIDVSLYNLEDGGSTSATLTVTYRLPNLTTYQRSYSITGLPGTNTYQTITYTLTNITNGYNTVIIGGSISNTVGSTTITRPDTFWVSEQFITSPPPPPARNFTHTAANATSITLGWTAPVASDSSGAGYYNTLTQYKITASPSITQVNPTAAATSATITGLKQGTAYTFSIVATNNIGDSSSVSTSQIYACVPSSQPKNLDVSGAVANQVTLIWQAPDISGGGPLRRYTFSSTPVVTLSDLSGNITTRTITGLTNLTSYTFNVRAVNDAGASTPASITTVVGLSKPSEPTNVVATSDLNSYVALNWGIPTITGGQPPTNYRIEWSGTDASGIRDLSGTIYTTNITGLTNGITYQFRVIASNGAGDGTWSSYVSATPSTFPSAPTALSVSAPSSVSKTLRAEWSAPSSTGGRPITSYRVIVQDASGITTLQTISGITSSPLDISGLTNGLQYRVVVDALNARGYGAQAAAFGTPVAQTAAEVAADASANPVVKQTIVADYIGVQKASGQSPRNILTVMRETDTTRSLIANVVSTIRSLYGVSTFDISASSVASFLASGRAVAGDIPADKPLRVVLPEFTGTAPAPVIIDQLETSLAHIEIPPTYSIVLYDTAGGQQMELQYSTDQRIIAPGSGREYTIGDFIEVGAARARVISIGSIGIETGYPLAPSGLTASEDSEAVTLHWMAPASTGDGTLTNYTVSWQGSDTQSGQLTTTDTTATVTGLSNGIQYTFTVTVTNSTGKSTTTASGVTATPIQRHPGKPGTPTAFAGNGVASVTWSAASGDVSGYRITATPQAGGLTRIPVITYSDGPSTTTIVFGLVNNTPYVFTVAAYNCPVGASSVGLCEESDPSDPIMPVWNQVGGAAADPYVTTVGGQRYKLPVADVPAIRFYQGMVEGKLLTVNASLRTSEHDAYSAASLAALIDKIPVNRRKDALQDILVGGANKLSFFERVYISYGDDSSIIVNIWGRKFGLEARTGSNITVSLLGSPRGDLAQMTGGIYKADYREKTLRVNIGISAAVYLSLYDSPMVRNGIVVEATNMDGGNGCVVDISRLEDIQLGALDCQQPIRQRTARKKKLVREAFVDVDGYRIRYVAMPSASSH